MELIINYLFGAMTKNKWQNEDKTQIYTDIYNAYFHSELPKPLSVRAVSSVTSSVPLGVAQTWGWHWQGTDSEHCPESHRRFCKWHSWGDGKNPITVSTIFYQESFWWPWILTSSCRSTEMPSSMPTVGRTWATWTRTYLQWQKRRTSRWPGSLLWASLFLLF